MRAMPGCAMLEHADASLAERCRAGDRDAVAEILDRHRPLICSVARRVAGSGCELDDVIQDALAAIISGIPRFRGTSSLSTWVASVAARTALNHARRARRTRNHLSLDADPDALQLQAAPSYNPSAAFEHRERVRRLEAALDRLPLDQRVVVTLRHVEGLAIAEVAEALGVPVGTVKSRLHHARKALWRMVELGAETTDRR
jgi:RNA polymerase sigma-70 factor (ECF subfamily)